MKLHHAVALAVVGWALIFPPMLGEQVDIGAPVNEWKVMGKGFATVRACEQFRAQVRAYGNLFEVMKNPKEQAYMKAFPERRAASRCVPEDDPRLKIK